MRVLEGFFDECHGFRFNSEATRVMGVAFEMALVALRHTDGVDPPREAVARKHHRACESCGARSRHDASRLVLA